MVVLVIHLPLLLVLAVEEDLVPQVQQFLQPMP